VQGAREKRKVKGSRCRVQGKERLTVQCTRSKVKKSERKEEIFLP
jgi:hypothetical protein